MRDEIGDRGHDLGDARLVVGAEQRHAVGRDQLVADVRLELRRVLGPDHLRRVGGQDDRTALVADPLRLHVLTAHVRARVHV